MAWPLECSLVQELLVEKQVCEHLHHSRHRRCLLCCKMAKVQARPRSGTVGGGAQADDVGEAAGGVRASRTAADVVPRRRVGNIWVFSAPCEVPQVPRLRTTRGDTVRFHAPRIRCEAGGGIVLFWEPPDPSVRSVYCGGMRREREVADRTTRRIRAMESRSIC